MAPTTDTSNVSMSSSSSSSTASNNDSISNVTKYGNIVQNSIGQFGDIQEQGASNDIKNIISSDTNVAADYKNSKQSNITPPSSSPGNTWPYANSKRNIESPTRSSYNGDYLQMIHDKAAQSSNFKLHSQLEAHSVPQNVTHGLLYTEQPTMPSKSNKESPPPYDQALLNHHNASAQQMNVVSSSTNNGLVKNGVLQRQVQAASDVVQTLSQLNSPPVPSISHTKPTRLPYGVIHSPSIPQTTNATLPHGDYHIASFTKPIPTSSYITSLSSDAAAVTPFQLPQSSLSRNPPSPPLQSIPSSIPYSPNSSSMSSIVDQSNSFTNTFLRGILTSIDSKDPVVANAWLETLLDAIDLLPADVIRREIVVLAVKKGHPSQTVSARKSSCRLLGKIATKLDQQLVRQEVLPTTLALCQDIDAEVRYCMCRHLALVSCGVGLEATKATILPLLVELCDDKQSDVRLAAIETIVQLLGLLDDNTCKQIVIPLVTKTCEHAKLAEDETLVNIAHYVGRLCYGLMTNLNSEQKKWFIEFYQYLSNLDLRHEEDKQNCHKQENCEELQNKHSQTFSSTATNAEVSSLINDSNHHITRNTSNTSASPMPDLVSMLESTTTNLRSEIYSRCRYECAYNFPAMVLFAEAKNFSDVMHPTFVRLSSDASAMVRSSVASSLHELAKIIGTNFDMIKSQIVSLFSDNNIEVLEHMVANMVHIIDALARSGTVLQFGQGGQFSADISNALLHCEAMVAKTRNWRLQADCLEKFSCLANCISPLIVQQKFIPLLFDRIKKSRTLPCKIAAARTLLVILRFTVKNEDRTKTLHRIKEELLLAKSCHIRMLFLKLCDMSISLFSKDYFKRNFFIDFLNLASDTVVNVRLKICTMLPRLKSLLCLPSDRNLLERLEETVKNLLLRETDTDVLHSVQIMVEGLDNTEVGVDGVPSMNIEEDKDNERKLKEEHLIESMEDQLYKVRSVNSSLSKQSSPTETNPSRITTPLSSPSKNNSKREMDDEVRQAGAVYVVSSSAANIRRRSESLPPPLKKGADGNSEAQFRKIPYPPFTSQISDPSGTYAHELSSIKPEFRDEFSFKTYSLSKDNNHGMSNNIFGNGLKKDQPYSSSLENLDPSAKEFLVDAGVILNNVAPPTSNSPIIDNMLPSATSMPNLSKIENYAPKYEGNLFVSRYSVGDIIRQTPIVNNQGNDSQAGRIITSDQVLGNNSKAGNQVEGDLSKYLISNEEMKRYESEYQKASIALKSVDSINLQNLSSLINDRSLSSITNTFATDTSTTNSSGTMENVSNVLAIPSNYNPNHMQVNDKGVGSLTTENSVPTPVTKQGEHVSSVSLVQPTLRHVHHEKNAMHFEGRNNFGNSLEYPDKYTKKSLSERAATSTYDATPANATSTDRNSSKTLNHNESVAESLNIFPKFSIPSKIAASVNTNKIQGSIEKFAEKIEAKRRSLVAATNIIPNLDPTRDEASALEEESHNFELVSKHSHATIMEKKLQAIKEQGIPKKRSLLKPPGSLGTPAIKQVSYINAHHKRFSLTDQMNAAVVGKHAMQRFIKPPSRQPQVPSAATNSLNSSSEVVNFSSGSSGCEEKSSESSSGSSDLDSDEPKITQKLQQVRRLASMDETLLKNINPATQNHSRLVALRNVEMKKRLPPPPSTSLEPPPAYTTDDTENVDMGTYVPPLTVTKQLSMGSNVKNYSGCEAKMSNNSNLVVKPIDVRSERASDRFGKPSATATRSSEIVYPNTSIASIYSHPVSRALPQVPKWSVSDNRQQAPNAPMHIGKGPLQESYDQTPSSMKAVTSSSNFILANDDVNQYIPQSSIQYQTENEPRPNQPPPLAYRTAQRPSLTTLYQQRDIHRLKTSQVSQSSNSTNFQSHQDPADTSRETTPNSSNNPQLSTQPIHSRLPGRYRCPPPYPFSPPPPAPLLQAKTFQEIKPISSQIPAQNTSGSNQPMESKLTSVEYRKPQALINSPNRFTKVPPPKYRPHQPPSAQKKPLLGINQQRSSSPVATTPHATSEGNNQPSNRSSFGGMPSNPSQFNKQIPSKGLKANGRYGKSLSAESILFTERMENEGTEFIEIPNETIPTPQHFVQRQNQTNIWRNPQILQLNQHRLNFQSSSNNKQRTIAQVRNSSVRSETPLPIGMEAAGNNRAPNKGEQGARHFDQNNHHVGNNSNSNELAPHNDDLSGKIKALKDRTIHPTEFHHGNTQTSSSQISRPSTVTSCNQNDQSYQQSMIVATPSLTAGGAQRRSSGIRMWQNTNIQKGGISSQLQRQQPPPRYASNPQSNKLTTPHLVRQSSQDNVRRTPSPQMMQQPPPRYVSSPQSNKLPTPHLVRQSSQDNVRQTPSPSMIQQPPTRYVSSPQSNKLTTPHLVRQSSQDNVRRTPSPSMIQQPPPRYVSSPQSNKLTLPHLVRQSSQDNVRRTPSPSMIQQRMQQRVDHVNMLPNQPRATVSAGGQVVMHNQSVNMIHQNPSVSKANGGNNLQNTVKQPRMNGLPQPSRKMSNSSPSTRGPGSPSMLQKANAGVRTRPSSMHNSPGTSRPSSPHLGNRQTGIQHPNHLQQYQKRRSYQHPASNGTIDTPPTHPYGSTGSLQNIRNHPMDTKPSSLPGQVNRPQSIGHPGSRYNPQNHGPSSISMRPGPQIVTAENSIPLPKRNILQSTEKPISKLQRHSLSAQHYMTKKPHSMMGQAAQQPPNHSLIQTSQQQHVVNNQQPLLSSNKSSGVYNLHPRNNGPTSLPMPGFSNRVSMQRRKP